MYHCPRARREGKLEHLVLIGTVRLDLNASCVQNGLTLFSKPTPCILLLITIKGDESTTMQT